MSIELVNVSKAFGETQVLRGLSERFAQGEAVCVMGRSGLGKTTLASIVMGLEKPDAGAVRGAKGKRFAAAFQEDRLVERLSAQGNLRFACGAALDEPRMAEAFAAVGLTPQDVEKPVGELSGGQRRRVALLRALLAPADVVVLDEPFKGLDEAARQAAAAYVRRMQAGRTLLCITHEEGDAALLGARVFRTQEVAVAEGDLALMGEGRLKLSYLSADAQLLSGDVVTTSGLGGFYPGGLVIGTVESVRTGDDGLAQYAVLAPAARLGELSEVFIIKDFDIVD